MAKGQRRDVFSEKEGWDYWRIAAVVLGVLFLVSILTRGFTNIDLGGYDKRVGGREIMLTVLNDANCLLCNTTLAVNTLTSAVPNLKVREVEFLSEEGAALVNNYSLFTLPSYLFDKKIEESVAFSNISSGLINVSDKYLVDPYIIGAAKYIFVPRIGDEYVLGDLNAPITLFMYSDFDCVPCANFMKNTLSLLKKNYIDSGILNFVIKDHIIGNFTNNQQRLDAVLTKMAVANCAGEQGKYWEMAQKLFEGQNNTIDLSLVGEELKINLEELNGCVGDTNKTVEIIGDNQDAMLLRIPPVNPVFILNGGFIVLGNQPYETFELAIRASILELQNLISAQSENRTSE